MISGAAGQRGSGAGSWRHKVFLAYVVAIIAIFLLPVPSNPLVESQHLDKLVHFGIFCLFALLLYVDRQQGVWWTFLISVVFAGGIELAQAALPFREGDWLDLVAGAVGAALGAVVGKATTITAARS